MPSEKGILSQQLIFIGFLCSHTRQVKAEKGRTIQEQETIISRMRNIYLIRMNNYNSSCKTTKTGKEIIEPQDPIKIKYQGDY